MILSKFRRAPIYYLISALFFLLNSCSNSTLTREKSAEIIKKKYYSDQNEIKINTTTIPKEASYDKIINDNLLQEFLYLEDEGLIKITYEFTYPDSLREMSIEDIKNFELPEKCTNFDKFELLIDALKGSSYLDDWHEMRDDTSRIEIELTDLGSKYRVIHTESTAKNYSVLCNKYQMGDITGILFFEDGITAKVEYTERYTDFTPFCGGPTKKDSFVNKWVIMKMYDDGWRVQ